MMRLGVVAAVCLVSACGGSDDTNCDFSNIYGTYKVHFDEQSGNCGDLPDINVLIDSQGNQSTSGCVVNGNIKDEADCTEDLDITCTDTSGTLRQVAHLDVQSDGDRFSGTDTISFSGTSGSCTSTYKISYTRQ